MTFTIDLTPLQVGRLGAESKREGVDPAKVIQWPVAEHLPAASVVEEDPMLALFAAWDDEEAGMMLAEILEENRTCEEFKTNVNSARDYAGARRVF